MWIWAAMLDLKAHAFRGKDFHDVERAGRALARRADRAGDGGELLPQRGVRVRHHAARPAADPAGVRARATAPPGRPRSRADRRRRAGVLGDRRSPLGTPVVRPLDGGGGRRDDAHLRHPAGTHRRGQADRLSPRQACRLAGRRSSRRAHLHPALSPRADRDPAAGVAMCCSCSGSSCWPSDSPCRRARRARSRRSR